MKKLVVLILMSIAPMFASASNSEIQENSSEHRQVISNSGSPTTVVTSQNEIALLLEENGFTDIDPKKVKTAIVIEANPEQIDEEVYDKVNLSASKMSSSRGGLENSYYIKPSTIQHDDRIPYPYEEIPITGSPTFYNVKTSFGYIMPDYYYYILTNTSFQMLGYNKSYVLDVHASWGLYGYPVGSQLVSYVVYDIYLVEIWINTLFKDIYDTSIVIEIPIKLIVLDGTED